MLSLTIHHKIYLTKEQRYALHEGIKLVVVGVSLPVWFAKNYTTEPAREVFCKYRLKNTKKDVPVSILDDGYEIVLPNRKGWKPKISDEEWREMNKDMALQKKYYDKCISRVTSENLLDAKDGGCECLFYREHNEIVKNQVSTKIAHFINIEDMKLLNNSMCSVN